MQSRLQMRMRARHQRPISEGVDAYGQPLPEKLTVVDSAVPCFAWYQSERTERQNNESYASIGQVRLIAPVAAAIIEKDVIDEITDRRGTVLFDGPLRVVSVARRPDHLAIVCRQVVGGRP